MGLANVPIDTEGKHQTMSQIFDKTSLEFPFRNRFMGEPLNTIYNRDKSPIK
jgi:hypothetical protein